MATGKASSPPPPPNTPGWPIRIEDRFSDYWPKYLNSVESFWKSGGNRRTDALRPARDSTLVIVRSERFVSRVDGYLEIAPEDMDGPEGQGRAAVHSGLAKEFRGTTRSNELILEEGISDRAKRWIGKRVPGCLSSSATAVGSLKDVLEAWKDKVDPYVKSGLILLKESIEMFKELRSKQ